MAVLNGSGITGLATKKANELRSFGYDVSIVDNAPTEDYLSTVLIDNTDESKPYTRRYLERRLGVVATESRADPELAQYSQDFVIIVGANEETN